MVAAASTLVLTSPPLFRFIMTYIDGIPGRVVSLIPTLQQAHCGAPWSASGALPRNAIQRGDLETLRHLHRLSTTKTYKSRPELSFDGAIRYAIQLGRLEVVQYLVDTEDRYPDGTEHSFDRIGGGTLMGWAVRYSMNLKLENKVKIVEWVANNYANLGLNDVSADDLSRADISVLTFLLARNLATNGFKDPKLADLVAARGNLGTLRFVLERGDDVELKCTSDAMDGAAVNGHFAIVQYLHAQRTEGCTVVAMDGAARNGFKEVVQFLHAQRSEGCTIAAMNGAACSGHLEIVQFLHTTRKEGCSTGAMDGAAAGGFLDIVRFLHDHRSEGCTTNAMNRAAQSGHLDVVQFLHDHRTEGCTTDAMDGAALVGNLSVIQFLHEHRNEGCTASAIDGAAWRGHNDVVQYLVTMRSEGCTTKALESACQNGYLEIVRILHEQGNAFCTTKAMDNAASNGFLKIVRYLHENRVEGCTKDAMTNAAINGHLAVVQYLGEHRHEGPHEYALERAAALGHVHCVDALIRYSIQGCLFEARRAALKAGHSRAAVLLSAWINPDVQFCCLRQYHVRPGPRWCQKQPQSENWTAIAKQTRHDAMTSNVVNLLKWFRWL